MARILMCPPKYYSIEYEINPWMSRLKGAHADTARAQWDNLYQTLKRDCGAEVELVEPVLGLPDLVFTANAGLVIPPYQGGKEGGRMATVGPPPPPPWQGGAVILSRFRFPVRSGEEAVFAAWFRAHGFEVLELPADIFFEGAGDALWCGQHLFAGYHFRSEIASHSAMGEIINQRVLSLQLADSRYYHLDTCFCPLSDGSVIYYPPAFDTYARRVIEEYIPHRIEVTDPDAARFGCNAVCIDRHVVVSAGCTRLINDLSEAGFACHAVNLSEYLKSGGSAKCLTLRLD